MFTLVDQISRGGFGRVERVRLDNGQVVARKVFSPQRNVFSYDQAEKLKLRFQREVLIQAKLNKDSFIPILGSDLQADEPWFLMPLAEKNYREQIFIDKVNRQITSTALADILNALDELHSLGFVHRDLKPENILLHDGRWKLSDFGLVLIQNSATSQLTSTNSAWGTEGYCAPEQAQDFRHATPSADIYSFGCILHDLFTNENRIPYHKHSAQGQLGAIIEKCTDENHKKRFKSIAALRGALFAVLAKPENFQASRIAIEWSKDLENLTSWDINKLEEFARHLRLTTNNSDTWALFQSVNEDVIRHFHSIDLDFWKVIVLLYCDWAQENSFSFDYTDVIIRRLEVIFELGDIETKALAIISGAELASSHNRWFVMRRVITMCNPGLDIKIAERIAIEIQASEKQKAFFACAKVLNEKLSAYHPSIFNVLLEWESAKQIVF